MNTQIKNIVLNSALSSVSCHTAVFVSTEIEPREGLSPPMSGVLNEILPAHINGISHIASILATFPQVQTVQIYAPGEPGKLILGNIQLTVDTIDQYAWDIQTWFGFLPSFIKPSLILDGCNVGDGKRGDALIHRLHHLTGSHITCRQSKVQHHLQLL